MRSMKSKKSNFVFSRWHIVSLIAASGLVAPFAHAATALSNGVAVKFSGALHSQTVFQITVPAGAKNLTFNTSGGPGDDDLYEKFNAVPTLSSYDNRSISSTSSESIAIASPQAGTYYVMVYAYQAYSNVSLVAKYQAVSPSPTPSPSPSPSPSASPSPSPSATVAGLIQPFPGTPTFISSSISSPYRVPNNSTFNLNCGTTYTGPIDVSNSTGVTIQSNGTCAAGMNPVLIPAWPADSSWSVYQGNIYVKTINYMVGQVFVDSQLLRVAHYPDSAQETGWLVPSSTSSPYSSTAAATVTFSGLPSTDLVGAKITYRGNYPWAIGTRNISSYSNSVMTLDPLTDNNLISEDAPNVGRFYLEGKLWMLTNTSAPGWAFVPNSTNTGGQLYVRMPDGQVPGSRVWAAAPIRSVINAQGSTNLHITNVRVVGGEVGIDASWSNTVGKAAQGLQVSGSEISYSNWSAIYASNTVGMTVDNSDIIGALHSGIYARTGSTGDVVTNSRCKNVNNIGMHNGGDGAIYLNADTGAFVSSNTLTEVGKSAIFVGESTNTTVVGNVINGACRVHGDCGGIYMFSPWSDGATAYPLNIKVYNNNVKNVNGDPVRPGSTSPERYAIYLDDYTNGVEIYSNSVQGNDSGMQIHNGFNNSIHDNYFGGNLQRDILFSDSGIVAGHSMHDNVIANNTFVGPVLAYYLACSSTNPATAAIYSGNIYQSFTGPVGNPSTIPYQ